MLIGALVTTAKMWKEFKCLSTDEWISKMWYIHTGAYHSAIKRNDVLIQATKWMNLKNIMQSERYQSPKATYCMFPLYEISRMGEYRETERRLVADWVGENRKGQLNEKGVSFWDEENVLELHSGDGGGDYTTL